MGRLSLQYNSRFWRTRRQAKFIRSPLCERCLEKSPDTARATKIVHHEPPLTRQEQTSPALFRAASGFERLVSLCIPCHDAAHQRRPLAERQFGDFAGLAAKLGVA